MHWLLMMANHLTKNDVVSHKPATHSSLFNSHHAVEARRSRAREQKLAVPENYHILTIIDEIHNAQKRAHIFAEQDIMVEKTKEKRKTLESFIYDTCSKIQRKLEHLERVLKFF
ncbi:unnamed protein product [Lactuca virosa]|uniref:Syntaxin N-terminal domain-containing protein n=1 Tax=Lactuca virosa TaxID=75947 RepID=A0AAU9PVY4_9ASTR|nr:unnamed protein product [Lactuca virosa]